MADVKWLLSLQKLCVCRSGVIPQAEQVVVQWPVFEGGVLQSSPCLGEVETGTFPG